MSCPNDPGHGHRRQEAKCHLCQEVKSCGFCPACCHWFCRDCSPRLAARAKAALRQMVLGKRPGCCGPVGMPGF